MIQETEPLPDTVLIETESPAQAHSVMRYLRFRGVLATLSLDDSARVWAHADYAIVRTVLGPEGRRGLILSTHCRRRP